MKFLIFCILWFHHLKTTEKSNFPPHLALQPFSAQETTDTSQQKFWESLQSLCGKSFEGHILAVPQGDTTFMGKKLVMHVRKCGENIIKIPFFVGNDKSRTWVFTKTKSGILLKHDHRHADGTPDNLTMYGGHTTHGGNTEMQVFPADSETLNKLPAAIGNVWWIEIIEGKTFTYNLRRIHTDRHFSVGFDLTKVVAQPEAPWGWSEE